jgi:hypothetical protein
MNRLNEGAKIVLLNGAPELDEKYEQYLLGPGEEIEEQVVKRKSSSSKSFNASSKKSKRKVVELESDRLVLYFCDFTLPFSFSSDDETFVPAKKAKRRQEVVSKNDRLVIYSCDLMLTFNFSSKEEPLINYLEVKLSFADGKPTDLQEAIDKNK